MEEAQIYILSCPLPRGSTDYQRFHCIGIILFPALSSSWLFLYTALLAGLVSTVISAYLMYVLVYVLNTICLVCVPVHVINVLLLVLYTLKWRTLNGKMLSKAGKKKHKKDK